MISAIDTETTGTDFFHGCRPYLILACDGETNHHWEGEVNPFTRDVYWDDDVLAEVQEYIDNLEVAIFHNGMFDIRALESIGIDCSRLWWITEDTLLASHVVCSGDVHGLKDISEKYFGWENEEEQHLKTIVMQKIAEARSKGYAVAKEGHPHFPGLKGATVKWYKMDYWLAKDEVLKYGFGDVERTFLFWKVFKESIIQDDLWPQYQTRKKLLRICYDIQTYGKNLYVDKAQELITNNRQRMEACRLEIKKQLSITYKLDLNKKDHLFDVIHTRCKIPVHHYTKGSTEQRMVPAMDKNAIDYYLEQTNHPALVLFKEYRKLQTRTNYVQGYLDWVDKDGRIHSNLNPTGTRETRQSSSSPNDQNIDSFLKTLFGPPPGKVWLSIDMVNIELRIWAYSVGNKELIDAFEKGLSVHAMIMELLFPEQYEIYIVAKTKHKSQLTQADLHSLKQYGWVKNGNFARIYGATDKKTNQTYANKRSDDLPNYCAKVDVRFPGIKEFSNSRTQMVYDNIETCGVSSIHTLGGYRLDVPIQEPFKACNFFVQGSAGWIMTLAMIAVAENREYKQYDCHMVSQVHDSLDIEISITPKLNYIIDSICDCIELAGETLIPTCRVSHEIIYHPSEDPNSVPF